MCKDLKKWSQIATFLDIYISQRYFGATFLKGCLAPPFLKVDGINPTHK